MIRWDRAKLWANPKVAPRVYFRWATPGDADSTYLEWLQDPEARRWLSFPSHRLVDLRAYIRSQVNNSRVDFFMIHLRPVGGSILKPRSHARIGTIKLVYGEHKTATVGLMLGECRGHGLGTEAIRLACQYARVCHGVRQVDCGIRAGNIASIKAFQRAGFLIRPNTMWGTCVS